MNKDFILRSFVLVAGVLNVVLGSLVVIGWHAGSVSLVQVSPGFIPMQYNTALGFIMAGAFLLLVLYEKFTIAAIPGTIVVLISLLTLIEYISGVNLGIDEFLMKNDIIVLTSHPGRMAPIAALCFFISAIAGRLSIGNLAGRRLSGIFGSLVVGLAVVAVFGYFFHVGEGNGWGKLTGMAVRTAIGFIILGAGLIVQSRLQEHKFTTAELPGINSWLIGYALSLTIIIFLIDIHVPLGVAMGVPYIIVVLMAFYIRNRKSAIILAIVGTILTVLGYFMSPVTNFQNMNVIANRTFAIVAIWVVAILMDSVKRNSLRLQAINKVLDYKVEQRTRQLNARNKELEQFVYIASHDLKEPLNTVGSLTNHLQQNYSEKVDSEGKKSMQYITEATRRMSALIKDLLDYSRIGRKVEFTMVDCNLLVNEVEADLASRIDEGHFNLQVGNLPMVKGNETELRLLFQNLISNAIKFRKEDEDLIIKIGAKRIKGKWEFFIADNGIGIDKKHQEKIFDIFQRLHSRSKYKGTGIGLAHCKKIVEMHDGRIWLESEPGMGSTFFFTLSN